MVIDFAVDAGLTIGPTIKPIVVQRRAPLKLDDR